MNKTVALFATLLVVTFGFAIALTPKSKIAKSSNITLPIFSFTNYDFFKISHQGVEEYLSSTQGFHFENKDIVKNVLYTKKQKGKIYTILSKLATINPQTIDFSEDVSLKRDDGFLLKTKNIIFYKKIKNLLETQSFLSKCQMALLRVIHLLYIWIKKYLAQKI
jgi:hypothetical protein